MRLFIHLIICSMLTGCAFSPSVDLTPLRVQAEAGDPIAMFNLGVHYDAGKGVSRDLKEAAKWYLKSAEAGFAHAQNSIGSMYQAGDGVPEDLGKARTWYEKAASQGHPEGTHNLAFLYDEGFGVAQDNKKAIELYTKAAEGGFAKSMLNMGIMYAAGDGVPVNPVEAYKWLDLARFYTQASSDMQLKWGIRGKLDEMKKNMFPAEIAEAEKLAAEWELKNKK